MRSQATSSASDDARLLSETREGNVEAFEQLVQRYQNLVCAVAYSRTGDRRSSEDIAQETFLAVWKQRETIREPERLRSWLCSTARNLANKARLAREREQLSDPEAIERGADPERSPLDVVIDREAEDTVWAALAALPDTYREPLVLFYRENQSVREVAAGLGLTEVTAKQRLSRGRQALRAGVRDIVERTLEAGRPRASFTAGVLALVGSATLPRAAAAAKATSGAAAKASAGSSKLLLLGLAAVGLIAALIGFAVLDDPAPAPAEAVRDQPASNSPDEELLAMLHQRRRAAISAVAVESCELHGAVVGDDDEPVEAAVVVIGTGSMDALDRDAIRVRDDGTWRFGPVPDGAFSISVTAPGHLPSNQVGTCDEDTAPLIETRLTLGGTRLRGRVADIVGGVVADATVWLLPALDPTGGAVQTISDDEGIYDVSVHPDRYTIVVTHPDYVLEGRLVTVSGDVAEETFRMLPAASIEGTVVDERGTPVADAKVSPQSSVAGMRGQSAFGAMFASMLPVVTDDDGRFRVGGLAAGKVELHASTPELASREPSSTNLAMAQSKSGVTITVAEAFEVSGFVVDEADASTGLAGARVSLSTDGMLRAPIITTTDEWGYFELKGVSPGQYRVSIAGQSAALQQLEQPIRVSDEDLSDVLLRARRGRELRGHVDPPGRVAVRLEPVTDGTEPPDPIHWTLTAMTPAEVTETGEFRFPAVAQGEYVIVAATLESEGRTTVTVDEDPKSGLTVAMTPLKTIEGTVVDDAGHPVPGVRVSAAPKADAVVLRDLTAPTLTGRTDDDGRFQLLGAKPMTYQVNVLDDHGPRPWAGRDGGEALEALSIDVVGEPEPLELVVATGTSTLHGVVVDRSGDPVADARVQLRSLGGAEASLPLPPRVGLTDEDGRFSFEGLFGDRFMASAVGPRGVLQSAPQVIMGEESVTLTLAPMSLLEATVGHQGESVDDFEVSMSGPSPVSGFMIRKHEGGFETPELVSGRYTVTLRSGKLYAREEIELGPEPRTQARFELLSAPKIRGRVLDADGNPETEAEFMLIERGMSIFDSSWQYDNTPVQADGSFEIGDMVAGRWTAIIRRPDAGVKQAISFEFDLESGQDFDVGTLVLGEPLPLDQAPFLDHSPDLGIRFFVGPTPPDADALRRVDEAADPRSVIDTNGARLWIATVEADSPADRAGLRAGDAVLKVGRREMGADRSLTGDMISLSRMWRSRRRPVEWSIERTGSRKTVSVVVGAVTGD